MPSDVQGVPATFVHFYQFGIRLQQAQILHRNVTGMSRWENKASSAHVSSILYRLANAVEDLVDAVELPQFKDRLSRAARAIIEAWELWVRSEGYGEDPITVQQGLIELEHVVQGLTARLGTRGQRARNWVDLGKSIAEHLAGVRKPGTEERLRDLLGRVEMELAELVPEEGEAEGPLLLGLPEDFQPWYRLDRGLAKLLQTAVTDSEPAATPEVRESLKEQRDKWLYEHSFDVQTSWDSIRRQMQHEHPDWPPLFSKQGASQAAHTYARKHKLEPPPRRQDR